MLRKAFIFLFLFCFSSISHKGFLIAGTWSHPNRQVQARYWCTAGLAFLQHPWEMSQCLYPPSNHSASRQRMVYLPFRRGLPYCGPCTACAKSGATLREICWVQEAELTDGQGRRPGVWHGWPGGE